jgi:hypothetical protein
MFLGSYLEPTGDGRWNIANYIEIQHVERIFMECILLCVSIIY